MDWGFVVNGMVNWNALQTLSNAILVAILIGITYYYAMQTNTQARAMQSQVETMQKQLEWERKFRPRTDAYKKMMEIMLFSHKDPHYNANTIFPHLDYIQPFASDDVKEVAKRIHESSMIDNKIAIRSDFLEQIKEELIPRIKNEIEIIIAQPSGKERKRS